MKYSCFDEECSGENVPGTTAKYHSMTNTDDQPHGRHTGKAGGGMQVK